MIIIFVGAVWGLIPPILDRFKTKTACGISVFAGVAPFLFVRAFEEKLGIPDFPGAEWFVWSLLGISFPAYIISALLFSKSNSLKARNTAYIGAAIGAVISLYTWSLLWGFGAA